MSKAFTREDDTQPSPLPVRRGPVGPRPLTADGHARLLRERSALEGSDAPGAEERRRVLDALLERAVPAAADAGADGRAVLGAYLEVEDADGARRELRLVGGDEADAARGWVRVDSPLGSALLGRRAGESVIVERPRDTLELRVLRVFAGSS
jgi:transcription elongation GreA/GreB family factor